MKFREKTFICTFVLFLICFGVGVSMIATTYNRQLSENCDDVCLSEQFYIARAFSSDYEYCSATGGNAEDLIVSYRGHYAAEGIRLAVEYDGNKSLPENVTGSEMELYDEAFSIKLPAEENAKAYFQKKIGGVRYIFIKSAVGGVTLTYVKDISYLDEDINRLAIIFSATAGAVAVLLAVLLFIILRHISKPLSKLTKSIRAVADGDYSVRADTDKSGGREFSELAAGFNDMTSRISDQITELEEAAARKQQLIDDLSHEMRTPLTSIHGYAEYLLGAAVGEEEKIDALLCIMSESERLSNLSQSLLDISAVSGGKISTGDVSVTDVFGSLRRRFEPIAKERKVGLEIADTDVTATADETLLELMLSNLIDNAIKACRDSELKRVRVSAEKQNGEIVFTVSDTGRGMTDSEIARITEPFYRTDKARSRADGGAGLGLALCLRIAKAHGGRLQFKSEISVGTKAKFILPVK